MNLLEIEVRVSQAIISIISNHRKISFGRTREMVQR